MLAAAKTMAMTAYDLWRTRRVRAPRRSSPAPETRGGPKPAMAKRPDHPHRQRDPLGKVADQNALYLCREFRQLGVDVRKIAVIPTRST
jgi:hypothetical protein